MSSDIFRLGAIIIILFLCTIFIGEKRYIVLLDFIKFFMLFSVVFILSLGLSKSAFYSIFLILYIFFDMNVRFILGIPYISKFRLFYDDRTSPIDILKSVFFNFVFIIFYIFIYAVWFNIYLFFNK